VAVGNSRRAIRRPGQLPAHRCRAEWWCGGGLGEVGNSLLITVFFVIGTVPLTIALAFAVANMLYAKVRLLTALRTAYFLPYITSTVAAGLAFVWLFNPQVGVLNALLNLVGLPAQQWLLDPTPVVPKIAGALGFGWADDLPAVLAGPSVALSCVIVFSIWNTLGFAVVIILAGLVAINPELREAARIDGANPWQMATRITLPFMSPTLFFLLVVSTIRAFQTFNEVYVLTGGGGYGAKAGAPLDTTLTLPVLVFRYLYERPGGGGSPDRLDGGLARPRPCPGTDGGVRATRGRCGRAHHRGHHAAA